MKLDHLRVFSSCSREGLQELLVQQEVRALGLTCLARPCNDHPLSATKVLSPGADLTPGCAARS